MNEIALAARATTGDAGAFGMLVLINQSRLRGFLLRLTRGDHALADDLAQESFLEAWRNVAHFRGGSFAGWLLAIAWSRYLMANRRRKLEPLDEDAQFAAPESDPDARLDLEKAMVRLSAGERAALTLCYALGYSHEEAAEVLATPLGTVKSHIARGREKLRAALEDAG